MARNLIVAVIGDDSSLQKTLKRASASVKEFGQNVNKSLSTVGRGDPADLALTGAKIGAGLFLAGRAAEGAGKALQVFSGHATTASNGLTDVGNAFQSLVTADVGGFFEAVGASAERSRKAFEQYNATLKDVNNSQKALQVASAAAALGFEKEAEAIRDNVSSLKSAAAAIDALNFSQREFNVTVLDGITTLVAFKGARDAAFGGGVPELQAPDFGPPASRTLPSLSPSQRRELELVTAQDAARIPLLKDRLAQLNGQLKDFNGNQEQRLRLATRAAQTEAELSAIYKSQAAARAALAAEEAAAAKRRAAEAKAAAEAARRAAQERREALQAAEQARQFRSLGLDASGNRPPPTIANLLKQVTQLSGRDDLSSTQRGVLARIRKTLIDPIHKAKPETRDAAAGLIKAIRQGLEEELGKGPLTKTTSLRANKILDGLGLSERETKQLRARLSSFNSAGIANAGTTRPSGTFRGGIVVENHNTVQIDGVTVGKNVTKSQQKTRKRNPVQKRGSRRGGV